MRGEARRVNPIRGAIEKALAGTGAFLRRDRSPGLYVTNLPAKAADCAAFRHEMERAGIRSQETDTLLRLTPEVCWAEAFAAWAEALTKPGDLTEQLQKTRSRPVCPEEIACWIEGVKRAEAGDPGDYERVLRQTAAVALRKKCGGLLYACGLCLDLMNQKKT